MDRGFIPDSNRTYKRFSLGYSKYLPVHLPNHKDKQKREYTTILYLVIGDIQTLSLRGFSVPKSLDVGFQRAP